MKLESDAHAAALDARRFWLAICRRVQRADHTLSGYSLNDHPAGLELALELDTGPISLLIQGPSAGECFARTPSFCLSITSAAPIHSLPHATEQLLRALCETARQVDPGGLRLPGPSEPSEPEPSSRRDDGERARAHEAMRGELHYAAFCAYKALVTEDLYPHVAPLGVEVSDEEIREGWQNALQRIQAGRAPQKLGLYVHVPYCAVACTFCYCGKTDRFDRPMLDGYVDRLVEEARSFAPLFSGQRFTSLYFGGGTPSILPAPALERVLGAVHESFDVPPGTQVIFEGNPDSLSDRKIELLAKIGRVTRLTVGVQSLDPAVQARVRRHNKPEMVSQAVESARRHGIPHINLDMMAGLPGQTLESFEKDMRFLLALHPDSLHINEFRPLPRVGLVIAGDSLSDEEMALRDTMLDFGKRMLADDGLVSLLQQVPHRTQDAANIQEYDLRRQNSSLLGLGFPSRAHSFANHYYAPDQRAGFDASLRSDLAGRRSWRAVRADETEEVHKYLVTNIRSGFSIPEFRALFGKHPEHAAPEGFARLSELGVLEVVGDQVRPHVENLMQALIYRVFLYSEAQRERIRQVWSGDYDAKIDWHARVERLVGNRD